MTQTITTRTGLNLLVDTRVETDTIELQFQASPIRRAVLHWGVRQPGQTGWMLPPPSSWPAGTRAAGTTAVETPLPMEGGPANLKVRLSGTIEFDSLDFVLFFPDENRWDNNGGRNYRIDLRASGSQPTESKSAVTEPLAFLQAQAGDTAPDFQRVFEMEQGGNLAALVTRSEGRYALWLASNLAGTLRLHWGLARRSPHEWTEPSASVEGSAPTEVRTGAAQTSFVRSDGLNVLRLDFSEPEAPLGVQFVLRQTEPVERWIKCRGGNFYVPIRPAQSVSNVTDLGPLAQLADEIIRAETTHHSWTLMHRFNLCHDLLDRVRNDVEGQTLLYVWLRFSAIRQLTWQRQYNTKPRELAHAQDRLTQKLAELHRSESATRGLTRLMLATVGRGGEGQRIRDEILNIMHRHHIKEVSGHFLEEWHQKLHNNTTPDDIVLCEAYLEFLRSHGNHDRFYEVLQAGGVSRQRLESFERPIRSRPDFVPHLKDGLIHDFRNFLCILKASHSGTDLETAMHAAQGHWDGAFQGLLNDVWRHRNATAEQLRHLAAQITEARRRLANDFSSGRGAREQLYLDLALEQLLRAAVERNIHCQLSGELLADLLTRVLENTTFSSHEAELDPCLRQWQRLQTLPRFGADWSLHAKSVTDRLARVLSDWTDGFYRMLQPKAEYLGSGFQAEPWTVQLFSEEVVRGGSLAFVLSLLLRHLDTRLRQAAHLGDWQIVSRGRGAGKVAVVGALIDIQRTRFNEPVVVVAEKVSGDEEIPENVTAVIAPDVTDLVSHVAVRARNARVLFATCHDASMLERLRSFRDRFIVLEVSPAGDVIVQESSAGEAAPAAPTRAEIRSVKPKPFTQYAVTADGFKPEIVGGKSCRQTRLRGQVPDWIHLPAAVALPFGVFEKILSLDLNRSVAERYGGLAHQAASGAIEALAALREAVLAVAAPDALKESLHAALTTAGMTGLADWEKAWNRIQQVWASKWNERAFLSRRKVGLRDEDLFMAVLIQQVVPADYAFVIHTVHPSTGNPNELFAEVVLGLGETLVGNYPGRALSFVWNKTSEKAELLSYPSKSAGLYGRGLIFRSDSNGEDLAGYAGAGLYDSVLLDPPRRVDLDYTQEPLLWDEGFRQNLMRNVARIGIEVERLCGAPQDIEGAVAQGRFHLVQTRPQIGAE